MLYIYIVLIGIGVAESSVADVDLKVDVLLATFNSSIKILLLKI